MFVSTFFFTTFPPLTNSTFDVFCVFFLQQHAFHFHCISQWLKQRKNCPLGLFLLLHMCFSHVSQHHTDNTEWEYQKVSK